MDVEVIQEASTWEIVATIATVLAVLVALFGPAVWDWWRRPKLELVNDPRAAFGMWSAGETGEIGGPLVFVGVRNAGRQQANDVQVFMSVSREVDTDFGKALHRSHDTFQTPIAFIHREGGVWVRQHSVAIPWGFLRPLQLLQTFDRRLGIANRPPGPGKGLPNGKHMITLDVLGSNFKVCRFFGVLEITGVGAGEERIEATWRRFPEPVPYESDPFPKAPAKASARCVGEFGYPLLARLSHKPQAKPHGFGPRNDVVAARTSGRARPMATSNAMPANR
jgi:hypothetical protein